MIDLSTPNTGKLRRDWGLQNMIGVQGPASALTPQVQNAQRMQRVRAKVAGFVRTAIYPQQLTMPRQYATTAEGVTIYKILEGREINGFREQGVRVVVQENAQQARFVMSPLFGSKQDALDWAKREMGVQ